MTIGLLDHDVPQAVPAEHGRPPQTVVAVRRVLAWPSRRDGRRAGRRSADGHTGDQPALGLVLDAPGKVTDPTLRLWLDLVEDRRGTGAPTVVSGTAVWSHRRESPDQLRLAVRATAPIRLALDIVLPAWPLTTPLRALATGGTIALLTPEQAETLLARGPVRGGVVIPCPPSTLLAGLGRRHDEPVGRHRLTG